VWLFDEVVLPVCAPALIERTGKPLRRAQDLAHYVLLHLDDLDTPATWLSWSSWFDSVGAHGVKPAGSLGFNFFDQIVRAALAGQGVALGRLPLITELLQDGSLIAPFEARARTERAYWLVRAGPAQGRQHVDRFVDWLLAAARAGPLPANSAPEKRKRGTAAKRR
jgi:DNA-binding transcriptional LysR family regulator